VSVDQPLAACRVQVAATHANGRELFDFVGAREESRHRTERFAAKIGIKTGAKHFMTTPKQDIDHADNAFIKELRFVETDKAGSLHRNDLERFGRLTDRAGGVRLAVARTHLHSIARIRYRLERKHGNLRDRSAP
jgi:hypothetical protein